MLILETPSQPSPCLLLLSLRLLAPGSRRLALTGLRAGQRRSAVLWQWKKCYCRLEVGTPTRHPPPAGLACGCCFVRYLQQSNTDVEHPLFEMSACWCACVRVCECSRVSVCVRECVRQCVHVSVRERENSWEYMWRGKGHACIPFLVPCSICISRVPFPALCRGSCVPHACARAYICFSPCQRACILCSSACACV